MGVPPDEPDKCSEAGLAFLVSKSSPGSPSGLEKRGVDLHLFEQLKMKRDITSPRTPVLEHEDIILKQSGFLSLEVPEENDPLSRAQILSSIRAAKRLHLPTGAALRVLRRQIVED